jgi:hypothetical protein
MFELRPQRLESEPLIHVTRGWQRRSRWKIERSMQQIAGIDSNNLLTRRRRDCSNVLPMQKSGARFIAK